MMFVNGPRTPWCVSVKFRLRGYQYTWITSQPNVPAFDSLLHTIPKSFKCVKKPFFDPCYNAEWSKIAIFGPLLSSGPKPCFRSFLMLTYKTSLCIFPVILIVILNALWCISGQTVKDYQFSGPPFDFSFDIFAVLLFKFIKASSNVFFINFF